MVKQLHRIIEFFRVSLFSIIKQTGANDDLDCNVTHGSDYQAPGRSDNSLVIYDEMRKYLEKYLDTKERGRDFWNAVEADAETIARDYPSTFAENLFISICEEIKSLPETRQYKAKEYRGTHKDGTLW